MSLNLTMGPAGGALDEISAPAELELGAEGSMALDESPSLLEQGMMESALVIELDAATLVIVEAEEE